MTTATTTPAADPTPAANSLTAAPPEPAAELAGFALPRRTKMLILGGALLAMFLSAMEQTVVTTATPRIVSQLGGLHLIAWMSTAFMLTSLLVVPIAGRLSDVYGRKPFLLGGLIVFMAGSAMSGFANSMEQLIAFRAIQGLGAGVLMANTMAISGDLFPPAERGKYIGLFAAVFGVSAVIGPTLGGFLTDEFSWRWVFWVNLPLGVLSVVVIGFFMPWLRPPKRRVFIDYLGVVTLVWALVPGLLALALIGSSANWTDTHILLMFAASIVGLGVFLTAESRAREPILPLMLFRNRTFAIVAFVFFGLGAGLFGVTFFIPLFVQGVIGKSATASGTIVTPEMLSIVVMVIVSGQIISRTGRYKNVALVGATLMTIGVVSMTQMDTGTTFGGVIWRLIIFGGGMGLLFPVLSLAAQNALPQKMLGTVSGSTQFFESLGGLVGITIFGTLLNSRITSELNDRLPADLAAQANPQQLIDPGQQEAAVASLGSETFAVVSEAVRESLSAAVTGNFWVSVVVAGLIIVALAGLKELRLRTADEASLDEEALDVPARADAIRDTGGAASAPATSAPAPAMGTPAIAMSNATHQAPAHALTADPPSILQRAYDLRLPPLGRLSAPGRSGALAAIAIGSVLGLVVAFGNRPDEPQRRSGRDRGTLHAARRGLADWLDPPAPPSAQRGWPRRLPRRPRR
ncbi:MAG TPA: MDR family MFS transporter [Dehalococcoidia bacterium]|nr:MDR family MFS transporter [Dehalococcoidia bacterium]